MTKRKKRSGHARLTVIQLYKLLLQNIYIIYYNLLLLQGGLITVILLVGRDRMNTGVTGDTMASHMKQDVCLRLCHSI